jgi:putative inorganic carbon (HCO3(-)) transporter
MSADQSGVGSNNLARPREPWRVWLGLLAGLVGLGVVLAGLLYPSPFSPLLVAAAYLAVLLLAFWFRRPAWALYSAIFIVFLPLGFLPPDIQSLLNRAVTIIALGVWLFDVILRRGRITITSTLYFMLGFILWCLISLLWSSDLSAGMTILQVYGLRTILFLWLIPNEIQTEKRLNSLMSVLIADGLVLMCVSYYEILTTGYAPGSRLKVLDVNENWLGILSILTMTGVLWQAVRPSGRHKTLKKLTALAFVCLTIGLVAMSGSRGSALSLAITLAAFGLWKPTRLWGLSGLLVVALAALFTPSLLATTLDRFFSPSASGETFLGGREVLWGAAWQLIRDHPLFGVGIGNAPIAIIAYLKPFMSVWGYDSIALHNPVLTIWCETGFPGLLLYLGVLLSAVWSFFRQYTAVRKSGSGNLLPFYALVSSLFLGYMASWIKGGGMESDFSYFMLLALLLIPAALKKTNLANGLITQTQSPTPVLDAGTG